MLKKDHYLKRVKFVKVFLDIKKDYELTDSQALLYGFLYNHCIEMNDLGYCGYSDENLAEALGTPVRTHQRNLKALVDKDLIYIKNAGARSKKAGESREIHINEKVFLTEDTVKALDEAEQLRKLNETLQQTNELLQSRLDELNKLLAPVSPNVWSIMLLQSGYITKDEFNESSREYNALMCEYFNVVGNDRGELQKCVAYLAKWANKTNVYNKVAYLDQTIRQRAIHNDQIAKEDANIPQDFIDRYDF